MAAVAAVAAGAAGAVAAATARESGQVWRGTPNSSSVDPVRPASGFYSATPNQSASLLHDIGSSDLAITQTLVDLDSMRTNLVTGWGEWKRLFPYYRTTWAERRKADELQAQTNSLLAAISAGVTGATSGRVSRALLIGLRTRLDALLGFLSSVAPGAEATTAPAAPAAAAPPGTDIDAVRSATGFGRLTAERQVKLLVHGRLAYMLANLIRDPARLTQAEQAAALGKDTPRIIESARTCVTRVIDQFNIVGANQNEGTFSPYLDNDPVDDTGRAAYPRRAALDTNKHKGAPWVVVNATDLPRVSSLYATQGDRLSEQLKQALQSGIRAIEDYTYMFADPQLVRLLVRCVADVDGGKHTPLTTVVAALARHTKSAARMIDLVAIHTIAAVHRLIDEIPASDTAMKDMLRNVYKVAVAAYKRNEDQVQGWGYHKLPSKYYFASVMLDVMSDLQSALPLHDIVIRLLSAIAVDFSNVVAVKYQAPYPIAQFQDDGALSRKAAEYRARVSDALKSERGKLLLLVEAISTKDPNWWAVHDCGGNEALNTAVGALLRGK
jgi:hypothetical protein